MTSRVAAPARSAIRNESEGGEQEKFDRVGRDAEQEGAQEELDCGGFHLGRIAGVEPCPDDAGQEDHGKLEKEKIDLHGGSRSRCNVPAPSGRPGRTRFARPCPFPARRLRDDAAGWSYARGVTDRSTTA